MLHKACEERAGDCRRRRFIGCSSRFVGIECSVCSIPVQCSTAPHCLPLSNYISTPVRKNIVNFPFARAVSPLFPFFHPHPSPVMSKRPCGVSGCSAAGTKVCTGCGEVGYCSKEHQIAHWKTHKTTCKQKHKSAAASASRGEEIPVTWEDQSRINDFSRLNLQLSKLDDELRDARREKENLKDANDEIDMLLDDDACKVKIGEVFIDVSNDDANEFVSERKQQIDDRVAELDRKREEITKKMDTLKAMLYTKFGKQINLENAEQTRDD